MTTQKRTIDDFFLKVPTIISARIKSNLRELGELCVHRARQRSGEDSWFDQTGNLRSSIGYAIYAYGQKQIQSAFPAVLGGQEGANEGKKMVAALAREYSNAYALVVVAAMNYAENVEALDSKDVLASTHLYAKAEVNKYLQKAIREAEAEIQSLEICL